MEHHVHCVLSVTSGVILEQTKFGYLAQPFYVPLDNAGKPLNGSFSFKEDVPAYLEFLDKGLENYHAKQQ